jgi:hypothetical protein
MSEQEIVKVYKSQFNVYTVTQTVDDGDTLYISLSNENLRARTTSYDIYDTMEEVNEIMAAIDSKQLMLSLIESCESEVTGYYGDALYCITDDSYEKLAEVLLANLNKFK